MSLKNISIRYQILIPIAMLVVATFSVLFFAKYEVESAIESVSNTARQAAADKDKVTKLADLAWAMRVEAIYGIYDEQRAKEMDANVAKLSREAMTITRELSQTVALRDLASRIETSVSEYSRYTQRQAKPTILSYFNQELEEVRYNAMVSEYRAKGADMMEDINALSLFINPLVEKDLKASDVEADQMIMTAGVAMSGA
nr:hypothetical protein [Enterovibrio nigricans]